MNMYKLSRYWNRLAFAVIHLGYWLVWDRTGKNGDILTNCVDETTEAILCDK